MKRRLKGPLDQLVVTASLRDLGFNSKIDEAQVRSEMAGHHPRSVILATAQLLDELADAGIDSGAHRRFLPLLAPELAQAAEGWLSNSGNPIQLLLSEQNIGLSALFALAGSDVDGDDDVNQIIRELAAGSLVVQDLLDRSDMLLELTRMALFAHTATQYDELSEARELARLLAAQHRNVDFDSAFGRQHGITLEQAWTMTAVFAVLGRMAGRDSGIYPWMMTPKPGGFDRVTLHAGQQLWATSLEEIREAANRDLEHLGWSFTALSDRPIATDAEEHCVAWRRAFERKAHPFGLFGLVTRVAKEDGIQHGKAVAEFGLVLQDRIDEHLADPYPHLQENITENEQRQRFKSSAFRSQQADWLLVETDFVVALEARHRPYSFATQVAGDLTDLHHDLDVSIVDKVTQCDSALDNAYRSGLLEGRTPLALIVNSCPVPVTFLTHETVEKRLAEKRTTPFRDSLDEPYVISFINLAEFRQLLRGARAKGRSVGHVVTRWRAHPQLGEIGFHNWATQCLPAATRHPDTSWVWSALEAVVGTDD